MTHQRALLEAIPQDHLQAVTGGGIGSQIGSMFGADGAKWGGIADQLLGMVGKNGGGLAGLFGQGAPGGGTSGAGGAAG
ncbi:MAG TPA: hypothetical protein VFT22_41855 [Kofleriaceae bacterium]|nr:hypothetical protein [Kofleriaceae bacterium]